LKTHLAALAKSSAIYGIGSALQKFILLLLLPILTKYLSPGEFGALAMLAVLQMMVQPVFGLGLSASMGICYFRQQEPQARFEVVWSSVLLMTASAAILLAVAWFFAGNIVSLVLLPAEYSLTCAVALTCSACAIVVSPLAQQVQFEKRARLFAVVSVLSAAVTAMVTLLGVVLWQWAVMGVLVAQLLGQTLLLMIFLIRLWLLSRPQWGTSIVREMLKHGLPLVPSFAFLFVLMNGNKYVLQWLQGDASVGIYSVGFNLGAAMALLIGAVSTAWYPFFMSFMEKPGEAAAVFGRLTTYYVLVGGGVTILFFALAKPVVILLTQPAFYEAFSVVGFVALAYFFLGLFNFFLPQLYFARRVFIVTAVQAVAAILSVPIALLLVNQLGLLGGAIALAGSHAVMTALLAAYSVFSGKLSLQIKYPWGQMGAYFAVFLALIAICTIFFQHLESMPLAIFGSAFFSAGAFVLGYLVLSPLERLSLRRCLIGIANLNRSAKA
jgi:O-antigen/teichoic acid export membrane protein